MKLVFLSRILKARPFSHSTLSSSAPFGFSFRALNSSASCQPSLEAGDNSAGEVHEEVPVQHCATSGESIEEKSEELVRRVQLHNRLQGHLNSEPDPEVHIKALPLRVVVESCARRWFKENLKTAQKGDLDAQVTVGQMICSGYGVPKDVQKGEEWIRKAQGKRKAYKQGKEPNDKKRSENEDYFFM